MLLLIAVPGSALAQPATITPMDTVGTGQVVYFGHQLQPPYIIGTDHQMVYLRCPADSACQRENIGWMPWQPNEAAQLRGPKASLSPLDRLLDSIRTVAAIEGLHEQAEARRRAAVLNARPDLVDSAQVYVNNQGAGVLIYPRGSAIPLGSSSEPTAQMFPARTRLDIVKQRARSIINTLRLGCLLVVDNGVQLSGLGVTADLLAAKLDAVRVDRHASTDLDETVVQRLRQPLPLAQIIQGGH